jgi:hypothetical protein
VQEKERLCGDNPEQQNSTLVVSEDLIAAESDDIMDNDTLNSESLASDSLFQSILRAVSSVFEPAYTALPESDASKSGALIYSWDAYTSTGPGSYPVPAILDTPVLQLQRPGFQLPLVNRLPRRSSLRRTASRVCGS